MNRMREDQGMREDALGENMLATSGNRFIGEIDDRLNDSLNTFKYSFDNFVNMLCLKWQQKIAPARRDANC